VNYGPTGNVSSLGVVSSYVTSLHVAVRGWGMQTATVVFGQQVALTGQVTAVTAAGIRGVLHAAVLDGTGDLMVDMSRVDSLDAVGLGVLVGTHRLAVEHGRQLLLTRCPHRIERLLRAMRLHRILQLAA
jgi:anti-sigma B factor antagonist